MSEFFRKLLLSASGCSSLFSSGAFAAAAEAGYMSLSFSMEARVMTMLLTSMTLGT